MAEDNRRALQHLIRSLLDDKQATEFFQLVRLLERYICAPESGNGAATPVGHLSANQPPAVQFRIDTANRAQSSEVRPLETMPEPQGAPAVEVVTSFLSLFGTTGILPADYTTLILQRVRAGDSALRDYLELFQQRLTELAYRVRERSRPEIAWERRQSGCARSPEQDAEVLDRLPELLAGLDRIPGGQNTRQSVRYFAGHYSNVRRSVLSLEAILHEVFDVSVVVRQFHPRRVLLKQEQRWKLPSGSSGTDRHTARLGAGLIAGKSVQIIQTRILVKLGPLSYHVFQSFLPPASGSATAAAFGTRHHQFCELVRSFVGPETEVEVQLELDARQTPEFRAANSRLGWNTWLGSRPSSSSSEPTAQKSTSRSVSYIIRDL